MGGWGGRGLKDGYHCTQAEVGHWTTKASAIRHRLYTIGYTWHPRHMSSDTSVRRVILPFLKSNVPTALSFDIQNHTPWRARANNVVTLFQRWIHIVYQESYGRGNWSGLFILTRTSGGQTVCKPRRNGMCRKQVDMVLLRPHKP